MAYLTKQEVRTILDNAPSNIPKEDIINGLRSRGNTLEGWEETERNRRNTPVLQAPQRERVSFGRGFSTFVGEELTGGARRSSGEGFFKGLGKDIAQTTVGSKGLLGVAQLPGKVIGQAGLLKDSESLSKSREGLAKATTELINIYKEEQDPARRVRLARIIDENRKTLEEGMSASQELQRFETTPGQAISTSTNAALTVSTLGTGTALKSGALGATKRFAPKALPAVEKVVQFGKGIVPKTIEGGAAGAGFKASQNLEEGKPVTEDTFNAFLLGSAVPVGLAGAGAAKAQLNKVDERFINSLLKPSKTLKAYGKNPAKGVSEEGLVAHSLDDLGDKVIERKKQVGQELERTLKEATGEVNVADTLSVIDDAITKEERFKGTNASVISRLKVLKKDLQKRFGNAKAITPHEAAVAKREVGELAKYTGNKSDDEAVNAAAQEVYSKINLQINEVAPTAAKLNDRYGNLLAADKAIQYRIQNIENQNLLGLTDVLTGLGFAVPALTVSGGVPGALSGLTAVALKKALSSPGSKTFFAKWFAKATPEAREIIIKKIPVLQSIPEGASVPTIINVVEKVF